MDEILERLDRAEKSISTIKNKVAYRDLRRMIAPIDSVIRQMSQEDVECRRLKKITPKYQELEQQANELLANLERLTTFAALINS